MTTDKLQSDIQILIDMPPKSELKWASEYTGSKFKTFIVAHIDFFNHELKMERIDADNWMQAVEKHSRYPYSDPHTKAIETTAQNLSVQYGKMTPEESFKQCCFDCDSMMNWIEISEPAKLTESQSASVGIVDLEQWERANREV